MADSSINVVQSYLLNNKRFNAPIEWEDVEIVCDYEEDSIQPTITIDSFNFTLEAREEILKWIENGGIFEGLPIKISLNNINQIAQNFSGYLDLTNNLKDFPDDGLIECTYVQTDGLDSFFSKLGTITYGYLESIGVVKKSDYVDLDYVVEKKFNALEIIITSIMIYLMIKELQEAILRLADNIAKIASYIASGITGTVAAAIYTVASALINIAYTVSIIIAIKNMVQTLLDFLIPPRRTHKVISMKRLLEVVCEFYGYGLQLSDDYFEKVHFIPSNITVDEVSKLGMIQRPKGTPSGIPNIQDVGYNCEDLFGIAKQLIDGKFAIIDGDVHLRPKNDQFWIQNSSFKLPSVLIRNKSYNTDELNSTLLINFQTDLTDEYTIDNYKGTSIEIKTDVISAINQSNVLLKGFKDVNIPTALGSRKESLNALENALKGLTKVVDSVTRVLGNGTKFGDRIKSRVGLLKVSNNNTTISKLVYLNGGRIPNNHRNFLSAEAIYKNYYGDASFVLNNFQGQKANYDDVEIPFGLESFKTVLSNSYFLFNNNQAKIKRLSWKLSQDKATIDFWSREVYTTNLKEIQIIPE